ncbi:MAG TPA: lysylphosphatidylglycerol synthase transmembrane domain-containing protein [Methanocorpusculum sp.]|nr:lysylphosphatidylglycerol synthase transmembrane domain-containing protein [Methanocorpusculum sp.]
MLKKISSIGSIVIPTIIAAALITIMLLRVWDDLIVSIQYIVPIWLVLAAAVCVCGWFLRGFRYKYILKKLETNIGVIFSSACIYVSQTANIIIPARLGDFVRMFILKHEKQTPYTKGFTSLIAERVYDILTVAFLGLCTLPFLADVISEEHRWFIYVILAVLLAGVIGIVILIAAKHLHAENIILKKILEIFEQFRTVSSTFFSVLHLSGLSIIIWLSDMVICYLVSLMFGADINFILIIFAVVIGNLVKAVPITPGGIGTYEVALLVVFEIGGVPAATATLIAVVDHLIKNLVTLFGGVVSIYYFGDWVLSLFNRLFKGGRKFVKEENGNS